MAPRRKGRKKKEKKSDEGVIRIGDEFQAVLPEVSKFKPTKPKISKSGTGKRSEKNLKIQNADASEEKTGIILWKPTSLLTDDEVEYFLYEAEKNFGCREEQALRFLMRCNYDREKAHKAISLCIPRSIHALYPLSEACSDVDLEDSNSDNEN